MATQKNNSTHVNGSEDDRNLGFDTQVRSRNMNEREEGIEHFGALELDEQAHEIRAQRGDPGRAGDSEEDTEEESDTKDVDLTDADLDDDELDEDDFDEEELAEEDLDSDEPDEKASYTDYNGNSDENKPVR